MSKLVNWLDRKLYPDLTGGWDHRSFLARLENLIDRDSVVLDVGAGRGANPLMDLRPFAGRVCGVDVDPVVLENPLLHESKVMQGGVIPYPDESFDVVFSSYVWEHLEDPLASFAEVHRVLKPGGIYASKTPNRRHYVPVIASLTPHWFHVYINEKRGQKAHDTFPTFYRLNTPAAVRRCARQTGFSVEDITLREGRPEYLRMSVPTYLCGWMYERLVNSTRLLAGMRCTMICVLRKA